MNEALAVAIRGIDSSFHEPYASLMKGLVYGLPIRIDQGLHQDIIRSGLAHLIVLSGANVTLLIQFSEILFFSWGKKMGIMFQVVFLTLFIFLVGPQPPLMRAACMFLCTVVCILAGRPSLIGWNLFLTVFIVACVKPEWTTSLSFQLSVFATVGIIIWGFISSYIDKNINPFLEVFLESWIVFLITTPLSMWYFKGISIIGPLSTALVSWLIVPLMIAGFAISILHLVSPFLARLIAIPTQLGLYFIIEVIRTCANLPFGYIQFQLE